MQNNKLNIAELNENNMLVNAHEPFEMQMSNKYTYLICPFHMLHDCTFDQHSCAALLQTVRQLPSFDLLAPSYEEEMLFRRTLIALLSPAALTNSIQDQNDMAWT